MIHHHASDALIAQQLVPESTGLIKFYGLIRGHTDSCERHGSHPLDWVLGWVQH
jgi:hypothetical protein